MEKSAFINQLALKIQNLGLTTPAIFFLENHKPLAFIASQLLLIAQPTFNLFISPTLTQNSINLLTDADQLEELIHNLEKQPAVILPSTHPNPLLSTKENSL